MMSLPSISTDCSVNSGVVNVTSKELKILSEPKWVNDNIIEGYFQLIKARSESDPSLPKVTYFSSFFMEQLMNGSYSPRSFLKRWMRKVDLFSYEMVLIPFFVQTNHWTVICVDFVCKTITLYDSLLLLDNFRIYSGAVYDVIKAEAHARNNVEALATLHQWELFREENWPRQDNTYDCGIFVCLYADTLSLRIPPLFSFTARDMTLHRTKIFIELSAKKIMQPDYSSAYYVKNAEEIMANYLNPKLE